MNLQDRINYFEYVFELLQGTTSRIEKEDIIKDIPEQLKDDFNYIIECLAGKHKFGYTYYVIPAAITDINLLSKTIKEVLIILQTPMQNKNLTREYVRKFIKQTSYWSDFFEPIVNRTLKLGIGNSLLDKSMISPMLAKKFEGNIKSDNKGYFITEKLDGNRCISYFENGKWNFVSRNGKEMHVNFDMSGLDEKVVYDGEILSPRQVEMSIAIENKIKNKVENYKKFIDSFSSTSGMINRHSNCKNLVYNVFDVMENAKYNERREFLNNLKPKSNDVRILPVLAHFNNEREVQKVFEILNDVTDIGGEGVMINLGSAYYTHKRTDNLLKLKKVQTMDMQVYNIKYGTGKYEGMIGSLEARGITEDKKEVYCSVGSGLSDDQRLKWAIDNSLIVGKIIEVSYFSVSQSKEERDLNTNLYSLRFPRLKRVRYDKDETSEY